MPRRSSALKWVLIGVAGAAVILLFQHRSDLTPPLPIAASIVEKGEPNKAAVDEERDQYATEKSAAIANVGIPQGPATAPESSSAVTVAEAITEAAARAPAHGASGRPTDVPNPPEWASLPALSPAWVHSFMDICETDLQPCSGVREFAVSIASRPKDQEDSWPYRMEYEITELFAAEGPKFGIEETQVTCNRTGCLLYSKGDRYRDPRVNGT